MQKIGTLVGAIITWIVSIITLTITDNINQQLGSGVVKVFSIPLFIILGLVMFSAVITALIKSIKAISSTSKVIKAIAIVFTILSIVLMVLCVLVCIQSIKLF